MKKSEKPEQTLNVIIADTEWETFESLKDFGGSYNLLNLSSNFAVTFILEYEKVDVIIISQKISDIESIKKLSDRKHAVVYIMGKDLKYPADRDEIQKVLEKELTRRMQKNNLHKKISIKDFLSDIFRTKSKNKDHIDTPEKKNTSEEFGPDESFYPAEPDLSSDKIKSGDDLNKPEQADELFRDFFEKAGYQDDGFWGRDKKEYGFSNKSEKNSRVKTDKNDGKAGPELGENPGAAVFSKIPRIKKDIPMIAIKQKTIVFIKAKGGVGSTVLSLYLAFKFSSLKTLLVDMNFSEGGSDIGYYLDLPKTPNMIIFTEGYSRNSLDSAVMNIKNNLDILQAPPTYELSKKIDLQDIYSLADVSRKKYHLIIFDLPNHIDDICLGVLDLADLAVLVSDCSSGSFGRLKDMSNRFIYGDLEKIWVLNRTGNGNGARLIRDNFGQLPGMSEAVSLPESSLLSGKYDFAEFDFTGLKDFEVFNEKILDRLTCD